MFYIHFYILSILRIVISFTRKSATFYTDTACREPGKMKPTIRRPKCGPFFTSRASSAIIPSSMGMIAVKIIRRIVSPRACYSS
jgi:hypothetical protein